MLQLRIQQVKEEVNFKMGDKIVPEIPERGICPLECFDAGDMLELGTQTANDVDSPYRRFLRKI
jgi:uncharacterized protein YuzE